MRTAFSGSVVVVGLLLAMPGAQELAVAQASREPTVADRYRDANRDGADTELPRLNAPQSRPAPPKAGAYLGVTFAGDERAAIVRRVAPGSPAEQAGLQANDLIETLQGRRIRTNQDVLDIVAMMQPGDVLDIGFTRRMTIQTQAPLASAPAAAPRSVGYPPELPMSSPAAPEDPTIETNRNSTRRYRDEASTGQRRNDNQDDNQSDENRRLFRRGLRRR